MSYPYQPPPTFQQPPLPSMPYNPPPTPVAASPNVGSRYLRTTILVAVSIVFVLALFNFLPGMVAQGVRAAYPRVHAVISGAPSGNQIAIGQAVTFSALGSTGKDLTYSWSFDDGTTFNQPSQSSQSSQPTISKTFTTATHNYQVNLTVTDPLYGPSSGADHTSQTNLTLMVLPLPPVASFTETQSFYGTYIDFDASASTGSNVRYQWDFGDPSSGNNTYTYSQPSHYYSTAGQYTVKLTVTDDFGQSNTKTQTITVTKPNA